MFAETGAPILPGLFCEVNATVLVTAYGAVGLPSATALWDQLYTESRCRVSPIEQHVHSLLGVCPVMAALPLTSLHRDQALALAGRGQPRFGLRLKRRDRLSVASRMSLLAVTAVFGVLPYAEELWRCCRTIPTVRPLPQPAVLAIQTLRILRRRSPARGPARCHLRWGTARPRS